MSAPGAPAWSEDSSTLNAPTLVESIYKTTAVGGLVVDRRTELYNKFFITYHDYEKQPMDNRKWVLDAKCTLEPANAEAIQASSRKIRPRGTWSVTAAVRSALQEVQLVRPGRAQALCARMHGGKQKQRVRAAYSHCCVKPSRPEAMQPLMYCS